MLKGSFINSSKIIQINNNIYEVKCQQPNNKYLVNTVKPKSSTYSNINGFLKKDKEDKINVKIPKQIFQTHKSQKYVSDNFKLSKAQQSWNKYKDYTYNFYSDNEQDEFMKIHYSNIYDAYKKCPLAVMKADLWRYCIIYKYGGIYADSDTICLKKPDFMIKNSYFVGVPENNTHLCQWIFSAPPESPILKSVIDLSVKRIRETKEFKGEHFVHRHTGPAVFTIGIENWLLENGYSVLKEKERYSSYRSNIFFYPLIFHENNVKHLFSGNWDNGWTKERRKYLNNK